MARTYRVLASVARVPYRNHGSLLFGCSAFPKNKIPYRSLTISTRLDPVDPNQIASDHAYCVTMVQQRDREGYLCGLLMPAGARKSYFAIRAFNVEIASIKDGGNRMGGRGEGGGGASEGSSLALKMRMQWWRDALQELYPEDAANKPELTSNAFVSSITASYWRNPVVRALNDAIQESNLTRRFLERLLDAREADLEIEQMATLDDAILYAEDTVSSLLYLSLECTGVREDAADIVASHAGVGIGLATALRSASHRLPLGELSIPADAMSQKIPSTYLLRRAASDPEFETNSVYDEALREAVRNVAYVASSHLSKARQLQLEVPKQGRRCLLPSLPSLQYLTRLQNADFDLWDPKIAAEQSRLRTLALLGRAWITGVF